MTPDELVDTINKIQSDAANKLNKVIPAAQKELYNKILFLSTKLTKNERGTFDMTIENLRNVDAIVSQVEGLINDGSYGAAVKEYAANLYEIQKAQNLYFQKIKNNRPPEQFLKELQKSSIASTVEDLAGNKLIANIENELRKVLSANVNTGAQYGDYVDAIKHSIIGAGEGKGILQSHANTFANDALNVYSRQYEHAVAGNLGLEWGMYSGGTIAGSRTFCIACVKKKYIHKSEIPVLLRGEFPEFIELDGKINEKTGLPEGMYAYENAGNFIVLLGGYGCKHRWVWVDALVVPASVKARIAA